MASTHEAEQYCFWNHLSRSFSISVPLFLLPSIELGLAFYLYFNTKLKHKIFSKFNRLLMDIMLNYNIFALYATFM